MSHPKLNQLKARNTNVKKQQPIATIKEIKDENTTTEIHSHACEIFRIVNTCENYSETFSIHVKFFSHS